jgi:hypothetical protein
MAENATQKQPSRGPGRPYQPGQSGNPAGKRPGTRHRLTRLAERLMEADAADVVAAVVTAAKDGDMAAARLVLDRVLPAPRGRHVRFALPPIEGAADLTAALGAVLDAVSCGEITPDEGQCVTALIEARRKAFETLDLEARVDVLEQRAAK